MSSTQQPSWTAEARSTTAAAPTASAPVNVSTPSSLFGFLAPGGQLPVHKDGGGAGATVVTGKPSIVKVTLSPPGQPQQQSQQQQRQAEETAHGGKYAAKNHQQAYQLPPTRSTDAFQSTPFRTGSAGDWYYANYNRTNVEPFVSKTSVSHVAAAARQPAGPTVRAAVAALAAAVVLRLPVPGVR